MRELARVHRSYSPHAEQIERRRTPDRDEFFARYLATQTPVILTDLVPSWPAFGKWTPNFFRERYGDVEVRMTAEREADPQYDQRTAEHSRPIRLADFVSLLETAAETNDFYMVARNKNSALPGLLPLFDDVILPAAWFEPGRIRDSSALWFGPAGTVTPLHHDTSNILFCQVFGRKRLRLIPPFELELFEGANSLYASLDPEAPGAAQVFSSMTVFDFVLAPGEALFLPAGYWHHVRALDVSISLAVNHFACANDLDWYRPGEVG